MMIEYQELDLERQKEIDWRLAELLRAGYRTKIAERIAFDLDIDLHHAIDLIHKCPNQKLCLRILL